MSLQPHLANFRRWYWFAFLHAPLEHSISNHDQQVFADGYYTSEYCSLHYHLPVTYNTTYMVDVVTRDFAVKLLESGNLRDVVAAYNAVLKIYPNAPIIHICRGIAYARLNDLRKAVENFDRAIELDLNSASAFYNRGTAYLKLRDYKKALADYKRAMILKPKFSRVYYCRGLAFLGLDQRKSARFNFQKAASLGNQKAQEYLATQEIEEKKRLEELPGDKSRSANQKYRHMEKSYLERQIDAMFKARNRRLSSDVMIVYSDIIND